MSIPANVNPLLLAADAATPSGFQVSRSLRLSAPDSSYLSRTPSVAGNRKTWTWSGWVKRSGLGQDSRIFSAATSGSNQAGITFNTDDTIEIFDYQGSYGYRKTTTQVFRDASAWYHFCLVADFDNATAEDRLRFFVNGVRVTVFSTNTNPSSGYATGLFNSTIQHGLGAYSTAVALLNGYLANVQFIDGQALTPSSFTEVSATTGQLIPKAYTGSYGLVADSTGALPIFNTTGAQGAVKGTGTRTDTNSASIVLALPMDGTNGGTSFGDQSAVIKGSGSAKTVTVIGNTNTSTAQSKFYGSSGYFDGTGDYLTIPAQTDFAFGTGDFTVECWVYQVARSPYQTHLAGSQTYGVAGDWLFVINAAGTLAFQIGNSSAGSYTSTSTVPLNVWTHVSLSRQSGTVRGFINGADAGGSLTYSTSIASVIVFSTGSDSLGNANSSLNGYLQDVRVYKGVAKYTSNFIVPTPNSFYLKFDDNSSNTATTLGKDTSGNGNNWTPNNLSVTAGAGNDSLIDTPTSYGTDTGVGGEVRGNYCTLNPVGLGGGTLSNGNLDLSTSTTIAAVGTVAMKTGKWYWEITCNTVANPRIGVFNIGASSPTGLGGDANGWCLLNSPSRTYTSGGATAYGTFSPVSGTIVNVAYDADAGKLWFGQDGSYFASGNPATGANASMSSVTGSAIVPALSSGGTDAYSVNFGQRAFAYTAPSGFKALCDTNLPTPLVAKPNTLFDVVKYDGTGAAQTVSGLNFDSDFLWIKRRDGTNSHQLTDSVRGLTKYLFSDATLAEENRADQVTATSSTGFSLGSNGAVNASAGSYVAWAWDAGTSTVSNGSGSITGGAQIRANPSAGFSVATWTGDGINTATVGHGLGVAPAFYITKSRNNGGPGWGVYHSGIGPTQYLLLNSTGAAQTSTSPWNNTAPTSTVYSIGDASFSNVSGYTYVGYAFSPVSGYSSMGSYVGNGSSDGPFVYTGFRPRWVLIKSTGSDDRWTIQDTSRSSYNASTDTLAPNLSSAELANAFNLDINSNGFKVRSTNSGHNTSSVTYIYYAVAENPFQYARAR